MKRIESVSDMIEWAKEINHGVSLSRKCDMQDIYARSNRSDLDKFFVECVNDRRLVICSVNNCMSFEEVEHLLSVLSKAKVDHVLKDEYAELDKRWAKVRDAERLIEENELMKVRIAELEIKANKFDSLKSLLND